MQLIFLLSLYLIVVTAPLSLYSADPANQAMDTNPDVTQNATEISELLLKKEIRTYGSKNIREQGNQNILVRLESLSINPTDYDRNAPSESLYEYSFETSISLSAEDCLSQKIIKATQQAEKTPRQSNELAKIDAYTSYFMSNCAKHKNCNLHNTIVCLTTIQSKAFVEATIADVERNG